MLYLLVSVGLIAAAAFLFVRGRFVVGHIATSGYVIMGLFLIAGIAMTRYSLSEIEPFQYERVDKMAREFPQLEPMVRERKPTIRTYEYLELLEEHRALEKGRR